VCDTDTYEYMYNDRYTCKHFHTHTYIKTLRGVVLIQNVCVCVRVCVCVCVCVCVQNLQDLKMRIDSFDSRCAKPIDKRLPSSVRLFASIFGWLLGTVMTPVMFPLRYLIDIVDQLQQMVKPKSWVRVRDLIC